MKCHYEVLEAPRDSDADFLKKQYRKMALKYHPDKNPDDPEGAKETFQIIQQAYDVLSDPQERAWYDNHREEILRGGRGEQLQEEGIDLFQYFSSSCYSGWGDDENGFFGVFKEVFNTIASEDMEFMDEQDEEFEVPSFGCANDTYEDVGAAFYNYWSGYCTPRTFSWKDKYDTRQAENRWMRRKMEQENKVVREAAKKERNTVVRNLVAFVRKRDKRVLAHKKMLEEKAEENKRKTQDFQKKQRQERKKLFEASGGAQGFGMSGLEDQLRQLEGQYTDSEDEEVEEMGEEENEEDLEDLDELYCVACDKLCKSLAAKENHETSKKHKENMAKLIEEMKDEAVSEEEGSENDSDEVGKEEEEEEEVRCDICNESFKSLDARSKHESSKKHRKNLKQQDKKSNNVVKVKEDKPEEESKPSKKSKGKKNKNRKKDADEDELCVENVIGNPENEESTENHVEAETESESPPNCAGMKKKEKVQSSEINDEDANDLDQNESMNEDDSEEEELVKARESKKKKKTKKGGIKHQAAAEEEDEKENFEEGLSRGSLTCAQCNGNFPSKNKLYTHLKDTGHAVFLPKSGVPGGGNEGQKKKKKGKK